MLKVAVGVTMIFFGQRHKKRNSAYVRVLISPRKKVINFKIAYLFFETSPGAEPFIRK